MRPLFKAAIDTDALIDALSSLKALRKGWNARYSYVAKTLDKGHLQLFLLSSVRAEFEHKHGPRSELRQLLEELEKRNVIMSLPFETPCCITKELKECYETRVKPLIASAHAQDEAILNEFFGLVDVSLSGLPLAEKVLVFITNNKKHYNMNVASAATTCIANMLSRLNRDGVFPPMGIHDIVWLDNTLGKLIKRFSEQSP